MVQIPPTLTDVSEQGAEERAVGKRRKDKKVKLSL
jgi:hypothetical protein